MFKKSCLIQATISGMYGWFLLSKNFTLKSHEKENSCRVIVIQGYSSNILVKFLGCYMGTNLKI